ncbi:hypothetical protein ABT322_18370, partial [Streptomyces flaveolus]
MKLRATMVTAGVSAAAALAVTGITYASAGTASVPQEVPAAVAAPTGGDSGNSKGDEGKGNEGKGNEGRGNEGRGYGGKGNDRGDDYEDEGRIQINERSY